MISAVVHNERKPSGNAEQRATRTPVGHGSVKSFEIGGLTRKSSLTSNQSVAKNLQFTWAADVSSAPDKGMDANYNRALNLLK
ncbi:hypothetical protein V1506DRAFT_504263, partial [Lipomyces tetrasporus]